MSNRGDVLKRWCSLVHCGVTVSCISVLLSIFPVHSQVYKWTGPDGQVHYTQNPPSDASATHTLDIHSQPTPATGVDNVGDLQEASQELRKLRAAHRGVAVEALDRPAMRSRTAKAKEPPYIGYEDRAKIDNLNSDIRRLSASTIGTAANRAREIRAAKDELRQIYARYGIKLR